MKRVGVVLCVVLGALVVAAPAAPQAAGKAVGKEAVVEMKCPEEGMVITEFLEYIRANTDAKILLDPNNPAVRKKFHWKGSVKVPKSKVFAWCRSVLYFHRMVLVPTGPREGNLWSVLDVNAPQIQSHPEYVPAAELETWKDRDGAYIVTVISLKHLADTARARNALAQLTTRQIGRINDIPATRSFVVADFAPVAHAMWVMLTKMDEEAAKAPPPKKKKLPPQPPPSPEVAMKIELQRYEKMLEQSRTETAARYFLSVIETLRSKLGKEPVVERD